ncbi:hypothetical protein RESH_00583 [Rhodopirellula europaea SH398]|uniref:Uncharacterized protein n=1 Tax=Rhodopirellula europaea SH398 TaxID=1263868 RepID=M5SM31_9BACT|nr:hypothetical protein RESH_00583 [Rhodopirellula europaea SH398]
MLAHERPVLEPGGSFLGDMGSLLFQSKYPYDDNQLQYINEFR